MREAPEFPENNEASNATSMNSDANDVSGVVTMNPKGNDMQNAVSSDSAGDGESTSFKGKAPRNVVLVNPSKRRAGREVAIVILCVAVVVLMLLLCLRFFACSPGAYDPNAKEGMLPTKTEEEMRAEMERQIEEGMFAISIYPVIEFPDGTSEGEANIENVPNNNFDMQVTITEDATGDVLYESGIIKPNSYVDRIRLGKDLDPGFHDATATFRALDRETHEEHGTTNIKVTVHVEN